ncbi:MAG: serine/threonine-protein kinase [Planctomycetota bacterium]
MLEPDQDRDPIERLAAEFVERQRQGENVSIAQYAAEHPELAEEIRDLFPAIAAVERLKLQRESESGGRASLGPVKLERLGDFRILREIGRGGMGVVFEAEQESLGRRVAIKVLPRRASLDEEHIRRFERETRIAANLHHTNVVPIFGVGEQDGFHYFVMQYIEGVGLDLIIERLRRLHRTEQSLEEKGETRPAARPIPEAPSLERIMPLFTEDSPHEAAPEGGSPQSGCRPMERAHWRMAATIGMQAARALDYAHAQGTLHRDIKPANLLLDAQGVTWVSDFGVAKALESEDSTRTGDITGTLRYMAPERFQGREDSRSDLYSLGLALYELLTLRPAYDDLDRTRLIHRITGEEPPRPRGLNPRIPRDLETVVLAAIARDPDHRYPSACALADDLQRFLEERPVQARRITSVERLWRWSRRNPLAAGLAAAVLVLLLLVAAISSLGYMETTAANLRVTEALQGEKDQRERAQATSELALEVLDRIYAQLAPMPMISAAELRDADGELIEIPVQPVLSRETATLLENLLVFYDKLSEQHGEDLLLKCKAAQANQRVGSIQLLLGQYEQARAAFLRSLGRFRELREQSGSDPQIAVKIACIHNEIGTACRFAGRFEEALEAHERALRLLEPAGGTAPCALPPEHRYELARTYYFLGTRSWTQPAGGPLAPGRNRPHPEVDRRPPPLRPAGGPLYPAPGEPGHPPPPGSPIPGWEEECLEKATRLLQELHENQPSVPGFRRLLACCYRDLPPDFGFRPENMTRLEEAAKILEDLVEEFPHVPDFRHDLCETYARLDVRGPSVPPEVLPALEELLVKGWAISEELVVLRPDVPSYVACQVRILLKLGDVLQRLGRGEDAEARLRKALAVQSSLANRFPEASTYEVWLAEVERSLSRILREQDRLDEARTLLEEAVERLEGLWEAEPWREHLRPMLGASLHDLSDMLRRSGDDEAEEEALRRWRGHRDD